MTGVEAAFGEWLAEQGLLRLYRRLFPDPRLRRLATSSVADAGLRRHRRRLLTWLRRPDTARLLNEIDLPGNRQSLLDSLTEALQPQVVFRSARYTAEARANAAERLLCDLEPSWVSSLDPSAAASVSGERIGRQVKTLASQLEDRHELPGLTGQLPPVVAQRFAELGELDVQMALRLVRRLVDGSAGVAKNLQDVLTGSTPDWLTTADPFAWIALGEAAAAYSLPSLSAQAFERAVTAGASNPSRWLARASLSWAQTGNLDAARKAAALALSNPAPDSLAAVVEAVLREDADAILQAADAAGQDHPERPVLEGHAAVALHNLGRRDAGIDRLRAIVQAAPGITGLAILLARFLVARASHTTGEDRERDLAEALDLATQARKKRRQWGSASDEAIPVMCEVAIIRGDRDAVFRYGLAEPDGEATPQEAASPRVIEKTALLAVERGLIGRTRELLDKLSPGYSQLLVEGSLVGADLTKRDEAVHLLNQAFAAASDPQQRWTAVNRLADLGEWPLPGWDELVAIAPEEAEFFEALSLLRRESFDEAVRLLRPKSTDSIIHAELLAQAYAKNGHVDAGVETYRAAAKRFQDPDLEAEACLVLAGAGRWDEAAEATKAAMTRLRPGSVHWLPLRRALIEAAWRNQDWPLVIEHARWYLAREPSQQGIRWLLVGALHNTLFFSDAWKALQEGGLEPEASEQAELWLELAHRSESPDVWIEEALGLYWRFPDSERFAETFIRATVGVGEDALTPAVGDQVRAAVATFLTRYPGNSAFRKIEFGGDEAAALETIKEVFRPGAAQHAELAKEVVRGDKPLGLLASVDGKPYTEALATGGTGFLNVYSVDPNSRQADQAAAESAIDARVVVDVSALYTSSVLPDAWALIQAETERALIADVAFRDVVAGRDALARLSTSGLTYNPDQDQLSITQLSQEEAENRRDRTAWMADAAGRLQHIQMKTLPHFPLADLGRFGGWLAGIELADQLGCPLLCDDASQREVARSMGTITFSTVHFLAVLVDLGRLKAATYGEYLAILRSARMVDLPFEPATLIDLAHAEAWLPGIASLQLTRPGFWASVGAPVVYDNICTRVISKEPQLLPGWVAAAAIGRSMRLPAELAAANCGVVLSDAILRFGRGPIDVPPLVEAVRRAADHLGAPDPLPLAAKNLRDRLTEQFGAASAAPAVLGLAEGLMDADRRILSQALFTPT